MTQILTRMSNKENPLNRTMADGVADAENAHKERSPPKGGNNAPEETTLFLGEGEMMEDAFADLRGAVILGGATPGPW